MAPGASLAKLLPDYGSNTYGRAGAQFHNAKLKNSVRLQRNSQNSSFSSPRQRTGEQTRNYKFSKTYRTRSWHFSPSFAGMVLNPFFLSSRAYRSRSTFPSPYFNKHRSNLEIKSERCSPQVQHPGRNKIDQSCDAMCRLRLLLAYAYSL